MMFEFVEEFEEIARIKVAGVGGAGGNAVNRMIEAGLKGVEFVAVNTDIQALRQSHAHQALQIGCQLTRGLGSGGDPRVGRKAVEEDLGAISDALHGSDMIFITAGMGGGTGTGAAPVVARIARELGALTVGIVTKPFLFEGAVRMRQAEEGTEALREAVDTLIVIPNQRLLEVVPADTSVREAFRIADNILYEATRGIYEIIARPNLVNLDFADVRSVMAGMGVAMMGTGRAAGPDRAVAAAKAAISSPLLEDVDIHGAKAVLANLTAADLGLNEVSQAMSLIQDAAGAQAHIIFGYGTDETLGDALQVTVVATGFSGSSSGSGRPVAIREFVPTRQAPPAPAPAARVSREAPTFAAPAVETTFRASGSDLTFRASTAEPAFRPAPEPTFAAPAPEAAFVAPAAEAAFTAPADEPLRETEELPAAARVVGGEDDFDASEPGPDRAAEPLADFVTPVAPDEVAGAPRVWRSEEPPADWWAGGSRGPSISFTEPEDGPEPQPRERRPEPRLEARSGFRLESRPERPEPAREEPRPQARGESERPAELQRARRIGAAAELARDGGVQCAPAQAEPAPQRRGFLSDSLMADPSNADLNRPAYTRKYLD